MCVYLLLVLCTTIPVAAAYRIAPVLLQAHIRQVDQAMVSVTQQVVKNVLEPARGAGSVVDIFDRYSQHQDDIKADQHRARSLQSFWQKKLYDMSARDVVGTHLVTNQLFDLERALDAWEFYKKALEFLQAKDCIAIVRQDITSLGQITSPVNSAEIGRLSLLEDVIDADILSEKSFWWAYLQQHNTGLEWVTFKKDVDVLRPRLHTARTQMLKQWAKNMSAPSRKVVQVDIPWTSYRSQAGPVLEVLKTSKKPGGIYIVRDSWYALEQTPQGILAGRQGYVYIGQDARADVDNILFPKNSNISGIVPDDRVSAGALYYRGDAAGVLPLTLPDTYYDELVRALRSLGHI